MGKFSKYNYATVFLRLLQTCAAANAQQTSASVCAELRENISQALKTHMYFSLFVSHLYN